jgi:hypothetical protein
MHEMCSQYPFQTLTTAGDDISDESKERSGCPSALFGRIGFSQDIDLEEIQKAEGWAKFVNVQVRA